MGSSIFYSGHFQYKTSVSVCSYTMYSFNRTVILNRNSKAKKKHSSDEEDELYGMSGELSDLSKMSDSKKSLVNAYKSNYLFELEHASIFNQLDGSNKANKATKTGEPAPAAVLQDTPNVVKLNARSKWTAHIIEATEGNDGNYRFTLNENSSIGRKSMYNELGLSARDVRILVSSLNYPSILARPNCIIVDIKNIQLIITHNRCIILETGDAHEVKRDIDMMNYIHEELKRYPTDHQYLYSDQKVPFEFQVIEIILDFVIASSEAECVHHYQFVDSILSDPELGTSEERLHAMMKAKNSINRVTKFVTELHSALDTLLDNDEDMARMYLTEFYNTQQPRDISDHEEVEMLLEAYCSHVEDIIHRVKMLIRDIQSIETYLNISLDSARNRMIRLELKIIIITLCISIGTFICGLFGMNLVSHFEDHPTMFYWVSGMIMMICGLSGFVLYRYCKTMGLFQSILHWLKIGAKKL